MSRAGLEQAKEFTEGDQKGTGAFSKFSCEGQETGQLLEEKAGQRKVDVSEKECLKGKEPDREGEVGSHG